jgi:hypothetical protein
MSTEIQPPAVPYFPRQRNLDNRHRPASARRNDALDTYLDGQADAFDEPRAVLASRIAAAYDYATEHADTDPRSADLARTWADHYATGAHHTWQALDRLDTALEAIATLDTL